jgi:hypothetical protein
MAEHFSEENCVRIVDIFFRLNINENMIRTFYSRYDKSFSQIKAYHIGRIPLLKSALDEIMICRRK